MNEETKEPLKDLLGREHSYLRIAVTEQCNLRCRYCMPPEGPQRTPKGRLMTIYEIETLASLFVELGVRKIRLTGGEPLIRPGIERLCASLWQMHGLEILAVSTNGTELAAKAQLLKGAGVSAVNVSLDSLQPDRFEWITLRPGFANVLRGIEAAQGAGFESLKVNTVIMRGINDDELIDFVAFARLHSLHVRFIEFMPFSGNGWNPDHFMPYHEMKSVIESRWSLLPVDNPAPHRTAKEFSVAGSDATVGFITTMSEHFCGSCNRLRLTADGKLRSCLFANDGTDLKQLLRDGASRDEIVEAIRLTVRGKWKEHPDTSALIAFQDRAMVMIGG